jgi:hypothetical protein
MLVVRVYQKRWVRLPALKLSNSKCIKRFLACGLNVMLKCIDIERMGWQYINQRSLMFTHARFLLTNGGAAICHN